MVTNERIKIKKSIFLKFQFLILAVGMAEKAKEFVEKGSEIYQGNVPDGAKEHH
jgi:hypothetical protein